MSRERVGSYEIVRVLARGGMATVYLARQTRLDREVALKRVSFDVEDPTLAERFVCEARFAAGLEHPNVVMLLDFFEHGGVPYIAMEYVGGGSLRPLVRWLTLPQVFGVLEGALAGLAHAERVGIAHRDLKPENLLLTRNGSVKIADFGIARAYNAVTDRLTRTSLSIGTPTYMAPEQVLDQRIGPWTDLYALGVVTYEMLAGRPPFERGEIPLTTLYHHVHTAPPSLDALAPEVSGRLRRWVETLLAKSPADRPASACEAWQAAEEIAVEELGPYWRRAAAIVPPSEPPADTPPDDLTVHIGQGERPTIGERRDLAAQIARERAHAAATPEPTRSEAPTAAVHPSRPPTIALRAATAPPPRAGPGESPPSRRPAVRALAALGALVAVAAAVTAFATLRSGGGREPPPARATPWDFDGDGHRELVAMAPRGSVPGAGTPTGLAVVQHELGAPPEVITPAAAGVPGRPGPLDEFAGAVARGDFNRDGRADLALGTAGKDHVSVLYGTPEGRLTGGRPQQLGAATTGHPVTAGHYGSNLASHDVDDDGFDDLVVAAPGEGPPGGPGAILIFFGSERGLRVSSPTSVRPSSDARGFGRRMRLADIDRDGDVDLVEGAPDDTRPGGLAGHASYCPGSTRGPRRCHALGPATGGTSSLAIADVDGDDHPDVLQGDAVAPATAPLRERNAPGEVRIWRGGGDGPARRPIRITRATAGIPGEAAPKDRFGAVLVAGTLDGDRFADMVVASAGTPARAGAVTVVRGGPGGHAATGHRSFSQATPGVPGRARRKHDFGAAMALVELTRDRRLDLVLAVPGEVRDRRILLIPGRRGGFDPARTPAIALDTLGRAVAAERNTPIRLPRPVG